MLVLQTEKVPNKSTKNFQWGKYRGHKVTTDPFIFSYYEINYPDKSQKEIFDDGKIVEELKKYLNLKYERT